MATSKVYGPVGKTPGTTSPARTPTPASTGSKSYADLVALLTGIPAPAASPTMRMVSSDPCLC